MGLGRGWLGRGWLCPPHLSLPPDCLFAAPAHAPPDRPRLRRKRQVRGPHRPRAAETSGCGPEQEDTPNHGRGKDLRLMWLDQGAISGRDPPPHSLGPHGGLTRVACPPIKAGEEWPPCQWGWHSPWMESSPLSPSMAWP